MNISATTILKCAPDKAWEEVQKVSLFSYITAPLAKYEPLEPNRFPARWENGTYLVRIKILGFIPVGTHKIVLSKRVIEPHMQYELLDNGYGQLISKWRHLIKISGERNGDTTYTDIVELRAGVLTPFVWVFALVFYRLRQARWQKLVQDDFRQIS